MNFDVWNWVLFSCCKLRRCRLARLTIFLSRSLFSTHTLNYTMLSPRMVNQNGKKSGLSPRPRSWYFLWSILWYRNSLQVAFVPWLFWHFIVSFVWVYCSVALEHLRRKLILGGRNEGIGLKIDYRVDLISSCCIYVTTFAYLCLSLPPCLYWMFLRQGSLKMRNLSTNKGWRSRGEKYQRKYGYFLPLGHHNDTLWPFSKKKSDLFDAKSSSFS